MLSEEMPFSEKNVIFSYSTLFDAMAKKKATRSRKGAKAKADLLLTAIRREAGRAANLLELSLIHI